MFELQVKEDAMASTSAKLLRELSEFIEARGKHNNPSSVLGLLAAPYLPQYMCYCCVSIALLVLALI